MSYEDFYRGQVKNLKLHSRGYQAVGLCPLHEDNRQSFSVNVATGQWFCFAGCGAGNHVTLSRRLGIPIPGSSFERPISRTDASPSVSSYAPSPGSEAEAPPPGRGTHHRNIKEIYSYQYEDGAEAFQVIRFEPKSFAQRRQENGQWVWKTDDLRIVPYRLPKILSATSTIFLVEGEKDVHSLEKIGLIGTTTPRGAASWKPEFASFFAHKRVAILPDNDPAGEAYANKAAADIAQAGGVVKLVRLPGLEPKGDVTDFLEQGGTADQILALVRSAPPYADDQSNLDPIPYFQNQGITVTDGTCVLPFEFKGLCAKVFRSFLSIAKECTDEVLAKISDAEKIWSHCHTQSQYLSFIKILQTAHELSSKPAL